MAVSLLAGLALFAQNQTTPEKAVNPDNLQKEAALGKQLADQMYQRTTPIDSPTVQTYVDRLGQKLAAHMPESKVQFAFRVIAEDPCPTVHEPSAFPGGYVFVPAALFQAAHDEVEFAGMLAHAMAHIAARQGTRPSTVSRQTNLASVPLIFGWGGACTEGGSIPAGFVATQRRFELQADALSLQTMAQAGFDPQGLVQYIERDQMVPTDARPAELSPLPPRDQRVAAMTAVIQGLEGASYAARADVEFGAAREEVHRSVLPKNSAPPSLRHKQP
jgi:predicted Zn-dependent protease